MTRFRSSVHPAAPALLSLLLLVALLPARIGAQQALEYEVKAAYLYNLIDFVTWPPDAFSTATDPIHVCVAGQDPFGPVLSRTMEGSVPGRRPVVIDRSPSDAALLACHLVFVPRTSAARARAIVKAVGSRPILTIGETPDFLQQGGMIAFVVDGGRVRFDVNRTAAAARGLALSSRLLGVARNIVGTGSQP